MKILVLIILVSLSYPIFSIEKLKFIGDFNIPTGEKFNDTEIGGLSGIVYDKKTKHLLAVSDDKSIINPARFYEFELILTEKTLTLKPNKVTLLKDQSDKFFPKHSLDLEGITLINDTIYLSSEGSINRDKPILPALLEFNREGKLIKNLEIPSKFLPGTDSKDKKIGSRDNLVFEALTSVPNSNILYLGTEEALLQDDNISTPFYASKTRIIKYTDFKPSTEFLYPLDLVPSIPIAGLTVGETGLVDLVAIDEKSFYSLERAYLPLAKKTVIKIFKTFELNKENDISKIESLNLNKSKDQKEKNPKTYKEINKTLILNLDDILSSLSDKFKTLDNVEGICFGPKLENGHDTLILVSDNNFSKSQRTQFLIFEVIP